MGMGLIGLGAYWPEIIGSAPDAAEQLYIGAFQALGGVATFGGITGHYQNWRQRQRRKEAEKTSGTFGEARFATLEDCEEAGLLDPRGLYLGMLDGQPLFMRGKGHLLTVAPARQGKGINVVLPNLLHFQGSVFVTDPKGELAAVTAKHRAERLGQKVFFLNPFGLHGLPQHRYNPLQALFDAANDPARCREAPDLAKAMALDLLPEPEDSRNRYFREGARKIMHDLMLHLATLGDPALCTLPELWRLISNPRKIMRAAQDMQKSDALFGMVSDLGYDLAAQIEDNADQFADFRQGAMQVIDIYNPIGFLGECVSGSDFDPSKFNKEGTSLYAMLPQSKVESHGEWLGNVANQFIKDVCSSPGDKEALFLLDEFANMGKMNGLAENLTALPGYRVRLWPFVQELSELVRIYGPNTTRTVMSQAEVKQFFAIQDDGLAQSLSAALGQRTVKTRNYSLGQSENDEVGESLSETGRPLMAPDEIRLMKADEQLLFVKSLPPIKANRLPFWFVEPWASWARSNPIEGGYPVEKPLLRLKYSEKD